MFKFEVGQKVRITGRSLGNGSIGKIGLVTGRYTTNAGERRYSVNAEYHGRITKRSITEHDLARTGNVLNR